MVPFIVLGEGCSAAQIRGVYEVALRDFFLGLEKYFASRLKISIDKV
jgi:hypothetical protein